MAADTAQEKVSALRAKAANAAELAAKTARVALKVDPTKDRAAKAVGDALAARRSADAIGDKVKDAQKSAHCVVEAALHLRLCMTEASKRGVVTSEPTYCEPAIDPRNCSPAGQLRSLDAGQKARQTLANLETAINKDLSDLITASITVDATDATDHDRTFERYVRFRRLLDRHPDARSILGKDAVLIASGKDGADAVLQLGHDVHEAGGVRRYRLIVATPLTEKGRTRLYDSIDGMAGTTRLTLGADIVRGADRKLDTIYTMAGSLSFAREAREYVSDGTQAPQAHKSTAYPWKASLSMAFLGLGEGQSHVLTFARQRAFRDMPSATRCPVDPAASVVDCLEGPIGKPKQIDSSTLAWEYRWAGASYGAAPKLSRDLRTRATQFDLPIYLVRAFGDERQPFSAGVQASWLTAGRSELTGRESTVRRIGVFVAAPLNLLDTK